MTPRELLVMVLDKHYPNQPSVLEDYDRGDKVELPTNFIKDGVTYTKAIFKDGYKPFLKDDLGDNIFYPSHLITRKRTR